MGRKAKGGQKLKPQLAEKAGEMEVISEEPEAGVLAFLATRFGEETVAMAAGDAGRLGELAALLPLARAWRFYVDGAAVGPPVDTVAGCVHWLRLISDKHLIGTASDLAVFAGDVEPSWEHPGNHGGGRWTLQLLDRGEAERSGLTAIAALLGDVLQGGELALGLVVAIRRAFVRISVWVPAGVDTAGLRLLGRALMETCAANKAEFQNHGDAHDMIRHTVRQ